ncbi:MAG TPA: YCF48-related protein [Burkholderiales bacterium]|nr:YCF48-related protein [Burkholderiales bacterium]
MSALKEFAGRGCGRLLGLAFCAAVFLAAVFAFSPRAIPEFPATGLRIETVLVLAAARAGERLVAAGERGRIFLSDDDGRSWRAAHSPVEATLTALHFQDARNGWAVGHDAAILRTRDAGETWQVVRIAPQEERPLLDVYFRDALHGFAVGAYGAFLETHDGGRTWSSRQIIEDDRHLNALAPAAGGLLIAGESGTVLSSPDGGAHWMPLAPPYRGSFFGVLAPGGDDLIAFGLRGNVWHSPDLGGTWSAVANPSQASLMGGRVLAPGSAVLVGQDGTLLVTRDGGRSLGLRREASGAAFAAVLPAANGDLLAFGERGVTRLPAAARP